MGLAKYAAELLFVVIYECDNVVKLDKDCNTSDRQKSQSLEFESPINQDHEIVDEEATQRMKRITESAKETDHGQRTSQSDGNEWRRRSTGPPSHSERILTLTYVLS